MVKRLSRILSSWIESRDPRSSNHEVNGYGLNNQPSIPGTGATFLFAIHTGSGGGGVCPPSCATATSTSFPEDSGRRVIIPTKRIEINVVRTNVFMIQLITCFGQGRSSSSDL
jgi:hypothetical protein